MFRVSGIWWDKSRIFEPLTSHVFNVGITQILFVVVIIDGDVDTVQLNVTSGSPPQRQLLLGGNATVLRLVVSAGR